MSLEMRIGMMLPYGVPGETERTKMRTSEINMTVTEIEWVTGRKAVMQEIARRIDMVFQDVSEQQHAMRVAGPRDRLP